MPPKRVNKKSLVSISGSRSLYGSLFNRRKRWRRMGLKNVNRPFMYKYVVTKSNISIANSAQTAQGALEFKLTDLANYAELTALYDEYCISKVVVKLFPKFGALGQTNGGAGTYMQTTSAFKPTITVLDYDDSATPASRNELLEYGSARMHNCSQIIKRVLTPKIAIQTYKTAVSSGYSAKGHQWIDCADNNIPHYGLKYQVECDQTNGSGVPLYMYDVICTYYVKFRGTR